MVNADNLVVRAGRVDNEHTNDDLKNRYDNIMSEVKQVWWVDDADDEIVLEEWILNGQFADYLVQNQSALDDLKRLVDRLKNDWDRLWAKAWKELDNLATFLDDIWNEDRMRKDYEEFREKMENPKKLNTVNSWEIRRLNLFLWMHKTEARELYELMKTKVDDPWMKSEDISFFNSVWDTLKVNYQNDDDFIKLDYPALTSLQPTVASLKTLLGENWDGKTINVPAAENSIVDKSKVDERVKKLNEDRIDSNKGKVKDLTITLDADALGKFMETKEWNLKYEWQDFDADKMMELFKDKFYAAARGKEGTDFFSDDELISTVDGCKDDIFAKFKSELHGKVQGETSEQDENDNNTSLEFNASKDIIKIKNNALRDKIKELWFTTDTDLDWNSDVKFNISKVKEYLDWLKDKKWSELESSSSQIDRQTWTIAVQIALMYLNWKDWSYEWKCNVTWIDWLRGNKSIEWIKWFQNKYSEAHTDKKLKPDWLPWSATINAILEELWWTTVVASEEQDDEDAE